MAETYHFTVNGIPRETGEDKPLLRYLRDDLDFTSVKDGCSEGACGTCTILVDGRAVRSCILTTKKAAGKSILTVEGLSPAEQEAFVYAFGAVGAVQCGFCTPGMVLAGKALLEGQEHSESYGIYLRLDGLLEQMQGNYQKARELLYRSIHTLESLVPSSNDRYAINIAGAYNYIAECCRLEGRYEEAFGYYDKAIIRNRSRGYYPGAAVFYTNYGVCAFQKGEYEAAYQLFLYAVEIYQSSHEYSGYPLALGYLALYEVKRGEFSQAESRMKEAHRISDVIGSPWWKGIVIYLSWRIRSYLDQTGQVVPQLRALWPASEREHCQWGLSYLERISPRKETAELKRRLEELDAI